MSQRFAAGESVRVRRAYPPGHVRTPYYLRGHAGTVERVLDTFPNPEERAQGRDGTPYQRLYRVRFALTDLWPEYPSPSGDTLDVEVYEHWLENA